MNKKNNKPSSKNDTKFKLPKFNFYWIYGIIAVLMLSMLLTNEFTTLSLETDRQTLIYNYIKNNDVAKIEIIENKNIAKIYINEESLSSHRHKSVRKPLIGDGINKGPHYYIKIGTSDIFEKKIEEAQKDFNFDENNRIQIFYNTEHSIFDGIWSWLPFILLIFFWIFFMTINTTN